MRLAFEVAYGNRIACCHHDEHTPEERQLQQQAIRENIHKIDMVNVHFRFGLHRTLGISGKRVTFL